MDPNRWYFAVTWGLANAMCTTLVRYADKPDAAGTQLVPGTASMPAMGPIGKGPLLLLTRTGGAEGLDVRLIGFVAIFSAVGLRDESLNERLGQALM